MTCVAALMRAQFVALAVIEDGQIAYIQRLHLLGFNTAFDGVRVRDAVLSLATGYGAETLVTEPGSWVHEQLHPIRRTLRLIALADAKARLLEVENPTHSELFDHMVHEHPKLRRFVNILPVGEKRVATSNRWRTVPLLASALGLAAEQLYSSTSSL